MSFEITMLGTSSMVPTKERNVQSLFIEYRGEGILIDCGEGTQRQMNICGINRNKIKKILISHWHGDHIAGLVGMLETIGHNLKPVEKKTKKSEEVEEVYEKAEVHLYGPKGSKERMHHLMNAPAHEQGKLNIIIHELPAEHHKFYENEYYELWSAPLTHSTPCNGYSLIEKDKRRMDMERAATFGLKGGRKVGQLQRGETVEVDGKELTPDMVSSIVKGKKFTMIADTKVCNNAVALAEDADIMVSEATFSKAHEDKAFKFKHLTSEQAAQMAEQAGADKLVLTHFSQRYTDLTPHLEEAKVVHTNTVLAYDFMKMEL